MKFTGKERLRAKPRPLIIGAAVALVAGAIIAISSLAAAAPGTNWDDPSIPKVNRPANINPEKSPVLNPPISGQDVAPPMSRQEQIDAANKAKAEDPDSTVICYNADGSVAGLLTLDKVDKKAPIKTDVASAICGRTWAGSHA